MPLPTLSKIEELLEQVERHANEVRTEELRKVIEDYAKDLRHLLAVLRQRLS